MGLILTDSMKEVAMPTFPLQLTFRTIEKTDAIVNHIDKRAEKLNRFKEMIISCTVVFDIIKRHKLYSVRVDVNVPGKSLVSSHNPNKDLYLAVSDAFDDMLRQLEELTEVKMGHVKAHPELIIGEIKTIFKDRGFGFIGTPDDGEFYFNASNVVHPSFDKLKVGDAVHFIEFMGDEGPQAHRVSLRERD